MMKNEGLSLSAHGRLPGTLRYARKMSVRIRKLLSTPYHVARFRGRRLLGRVGRYIDAATFPGQRDFEVRRDFEEIRYLIPITFKW